MCRMLFLLHNQVPFWGYKEHTSCYNLESWTWNTDSNLCNGPLAPFSIGKCHSWMSKGRQKVSKCHPWFVVPLTFLFLGQWKTCIVLLLFAKSSPIMRFRTSYFMLRSRILLLNHRGYFGYWTISTILNRKYHLMSKACQKVKKNLPVALRLPTLIIISSEK